jgi:nitroreductase/NAD-dependent dihydropyrimidine dehydrogenase PreA subunit
MINYEVGKCTRCGSCIKTCHQFCMKMEDTGIKIDYSLCSTCTQCIAVCPSQALSWNGIPSVKVDKNLLPRSEQMKEFFKSRRSIFLFQEKKIDRAVLEDIAVMGKYSPTNNYDLDVVIVDDQEVISLLNRTAIKNVKKLYNMFFRYKIVFGTIKALSPRMRRNANVRAKMIKNIESGKIFRKAAALIIVYGDEAAEYTELSAQFFLYNMILYAKSLGIGVRQSGAGVSFFRKNKRISRLLGIPEGKKMQGMIFLGYPAIEYPNKVEGLKPRISFV